MSKTKQKEININEAAKDLFVVLDDSAQLKQMKNGKLIYQGYILPDDQKNRIIGEAKIVLDLEIWKILMDDMKQVACRKMYEDDTDGQLRIGGKWILYTLDVISKKLYNLSTLKK